MKFFCFCLFFLFFGSFQLENVFGQNISRHTEYALRTQREIQTDLPLDEESFICAHNSYNSAGNGFLISAATSSNCDFPPPYSKSNCMFLTNQLLTLTSLFYAGVRMFEIDPIKECSGEEITCKHGFESLCEWGWIKLDTIFSQLNTLLEKYPSEVVFFFVEFKEDTPDLKKVPLSVMETLIENNFGNRVLTAAERGNRNGTWPSISEMRQLNKNVVFFTADKFTEYVNTRYIHSAWFGTGRGIKSFRSSEDRTLRCSNGIKKLRVYDDVTNVDSPLFPEYNGPEAVGYIGDSIKADLLECGITLPCPDAITISLVETSIWTWATTEPTLGISTQLVTPIPGTHCTRLDVASDRWYLEDRCNTEYRVVCHDVSTNYWNISTTVASHGDGNTVCQQLGPNYEFATPSAYVYQKQVLEQAKSLNVDNMWISWPTKIVDVDSAIIGDVRQGENSTEEEDDDGLFSDCFVATAAYDSHLDNRIWVLRTVRDQILMKSSFGKSFVDLYYHYSPSIAHWVRQSKWRKFIIEVLLSPIISFAQGV